MPDLPCVDISSIFGVRVAVVALKARHFFLSADAHIGNDRKRQ
jgi:hypothetical protein